MGKARRGDPVYANGDFALARRGREAVVTYYDANGKRRRARLGIPFAKRPGAELEACKKALDEFADRVRAVAKAQDDHTCGALWKLWLAEREADKLSNDIYEANWSSLGPFFANRKPGLLVTQDFRDYAEERFSKGRSSWTVHTELSRLRSCLQWAAKHRKIAFAPIVWVPQPGESRERVLSIEEARRLVAAALQGDPHIYLFTVIAFATGARHRAILDLTWDRIDFINGIIEFDEDLPRDPMSKAWRKGRATVPMGPTVRAALDLAFKGRQTKFVIEHGGRRLQSAREGFANAVARAGLGTWVDAPTEANPKHRRLETDVTPHTIRHTVNTWLEAKAVEERRRQQLLGHAPGSKVTDKVYTHADAKLLTDAVSLLDADFAPLPKLSHEPVPEEGQNTPETGLSVPLGQMPVVEGRGE